MNHLAQIRKKLPEFNLDALLITSSVGERYALGFHGEGLVLVTRQGAHYATDGRYIEAAGEQVRCAELALTTRGRGQLAFAKEWMQAQGLQRVGFESGELSVDALRRLEAELPCTLVPAQGLLEGLRASKDEGELTLMRRAQAITDQSFAAILDFLRPGLTEREVAARLCYELLSRGGEQLSFDPIVAAGANGSRPHAVPGERVLETGGFITMDFGCRVAGYCSDMTRTVALGRPTQEMEQVYAIVLQAQKAGIAAARGGISGHDLDAAARQVIEQAGYGQFFSHSFGHSLGLKIHEAPNAAPGADTPLPVGGVLSAEPGIYLPGRFGVRIEDVLVLTKDGCETITQSPKELIVL